MLRDEWEPIDRIIVSTKQTKDGLVILTPLAQTIIRAASFEGIQSIILNANQVYQKAILKALLDRNLIRTLRDVQIINNQIDTVWARDSAPIIRFSADNTHTAILTGTLSIDLQEEDKANASIKRVGQALKINYEEVPMVTSQTPQPLKFPLRIDGGSWMTTQGGRTLLTTARFYEHNGGADLQEKINGLLNDKFGIEQIILLKPLMENICGKFNSYKLSNSHIDLQVRALPDNQVLVARVPDDDPQLPILQENISILKKAGFIVLEVVNAKPKSTDENLIFRTYTNALFLNQTVLIPQYGDEKADLAALEVYETALNAQKKPDDKTRYKIVQVDCSEVIKKSGALRCAGRELPRVPSKDKGPAVCSQNNTTVLFDASSGLLSFSSGLINFIGSLSDTSTAVALADELLIGATLMVEELVFEPRLSANGQYVFMGGSLQLSKAGLNILTARLPILTINKFLPEKGFNLFGALSKITLLPILLG